MNGKIHVVQVEGGFIVRCPVHGDLPAVHSSHMAAALDSLGHAMAEFHGEGAR